LSTILKQWAKQSTLLKRYYLWLNTKSRDYFPDWEGILSLDRVFWDEALEKSQNGPKVLVATSLGGHQAVAMVEMLLAASLTLHGANVHVLLCDEALPACMLCSHELYPNHQQFVNNGPSKDLCKSCFKPAYKVFQALGVRVHRYSEYLTPEDRREAEINSSALPLEDIAGYKPGGVAVGEHALAGALRFFARGTLEGEPLAEPVLCRYLKAALLTSAVTRNLLKAFKFDCAVFHHGIYVPQGIIGEVCRKQKVRVVNWNPAYRKQCFIFSHNDTYHHTLMQEPVSKWEHIPWNKTMEKELADYLKSRWHGTNDWIWFNRTPDADLKSIESQIGVDFSKPCIGLLTNVIWDAQLHYPANAFPNMVDWLIQTVDYFSKRPELQLLIRVHPAEVTGAIPSRQKAEDEIRKAFPTLPPNIFIIPPESPVSTYAAMAPCNAVIIYGTKTGIELASVGTRVIVAGEAWVRNKGITMDAASRDEYFQFLDLLPFTQSVEEAKILRARKYAYHFFFRRMIPVEFMEPSEGKTPYRMNLKNVRELMPGKSRGLDIICDGILKGTDFIYPAEKMAGRQSARQSG
jgi:hypothetical protein